MFDISIALRSQLTEAAAGRQHQAGLRYVAKLALWGLSAAGVAALAFGIPALWMLIAAKVQAAAGFMGMAKATAAVIYSGIAITYALVAYAIAWVMARSAAGGTAPPPRAQDPWMRSMRDEPEPTEPPTGIELVCICAAVAAGVAFVIWFFFWAESPIPTY